MALKHIMVKQTMEITRESFTIPPLPCFTRGHGRAVTLTAAQAHFFAWATSDKMLWPSPDGIFGLEMLGCCAPGAYCLVWVIHREVLSSLGV